MKYKFDILLDGVDATTSGGAVAVAGHRRLGIQLKAANIGTGSGIFKVLGTTNGTDWAFLNLIDNLATTNGQTLTRVASKTLNSNTNVLLWVDEGLALRAIKTYLTWATDGSYSAYLIASD